MEFPLQQVFLHLCCVEYALEANGGYVDTFLSFTGDHPCASECSEVPRGFKSGVPDLVLHRVPTHGVVFCCFPVIIKDGVVRRADQ